MPRFFYCFAIALLLLAAATAPSRASSTELWQSGVSLIPYPQQVQTGGEDFTFSGRISVSIRNSSAVNTVALNAMFVVEELKRILSEEFSVEHAAGEASPLVRFILAKVPDKVGEQGYVLETFADSVTIRAATPQGLFYGVQTLAQLIQPAREGWVVRGVKITDWPNIPQRAVHYDTKHFQEKADYVRNFIRTLARYKVNVLIWEWEDKFAYESHPEVGAPGAFTRQEMQALTRYAQKYHIQIVPLVQGLGHVSFILKHPENRHLRELPSNNWGFCPLREGTYELEFDLIREAIEATPGSKYYHIGCDETYVLGKGVECGCKAKAEEIGHRGLKQIYINRIAEYVKKLGRIPIAWDQGFEPGEKVKPVEGLMVWGGYDEARDREALDKGYQLYIYDPNPGIEHLFLPYFHRENIYNQYGGHLERSYKTMAPAALSGKFEGMISTSWNCSGVHNQGWMLRYITAAEYSWSGGNPGLEEFTDKFFVNYYGPQSRDVRELYELLNRTSYYYMNSFERKVWHWGEVGKTHLPDLPRDDIEYDPYWNTEYAERITASREILPRMARAKEICRLNKELGARNSYDFELFGGLAELFEHTANTYLALSRLENSITEAHRAHFDNPAGAYAALQKAAGIVEDNLAERERVFQALVTTWEKSQLPRGMSTPEKKYVHGRDQQRNFANRRPDLSFMICDEQMLGLEDYLTKLREYMDWYKGEHL